MGALSTKWWRIAAAAIALVLAAAGVHGLFEPTTGEWYQWTLGRGSLVAAPIVIVFGLVVRHRHRRRGDLLTAIGVIPAMAAIVLFWSPPFLLFGALSIAVFVSAVNDADRPGGAVSKESARGVRPK